MLLIYLALHCNKLSYSIYFEHHMMQYNLVVSGKPTYKNI